MADERKDIIDELEKSVGEPDVYFKGKPIVDEKDWNSDTPNPEVSAVIPRRIARYAKEFAALHPEWSTPEGAKDKCREASSGFVNFLIYCAVEGAVVDEVTVVNGTAHKAVVLDGMIIDFTARQFDPEANFPLFVMNRNAYPY